MLPAEAVPSSLAATLDHATPRNAGGRTNHKDCVAACFKCNQKKGAMSAEEFQRSPELARIMMGREKGGLLVSPSQPSPASMADR